MDAETSMEAVKEGAKFGTKLVEVIQKIYGPHLTRKQADADEYSALKKIQTIRDNPDMIISYDNGKLNIRQCTSEEIEIRIKNRTYAEEMRQENNINNVLKVASEELSPDKDVSDEPIDDDWIIRFFSIVRDISNEEMQYVWGKILAGEIKKPSSFSLRTLETLRNISTEEAELFQKIGAYFIENEHGKYLPSNEYFLSRYGINTSDIIRLEECGLVNATPIYETHYISKKERYEYFKCSSYIIKIHDKTAYNKNVKDKYAFGLYQLTKAGLEISTLFEQKNDMSYAFSLVFFFIDCDKRKEVELHKIIKEESDTIEISSNDLLENFKKKNQL